MNLAHFVDPRSEAACLGIVIGDVVVDFRAAWELGIPEAALEPTLIGTIQANLENGALHALGEALASGVPEDAREWTHPLAGVRLLPPVRPRSFRDFYAFEAHVRSARARRGLGMIPEWSQAPAFYFSNTASIFGPGEPVPRPPETRELDYELEIAVVIGRGGRDIPAEEADDHIAGFTILNDWSARDIQRREMKVGLGPAKAKDFATSLGPFLVTPDAVEDRAERTIHGCRWDLEMRAFVNGRLYSRGNSRDMHWTFAELIAHASRRTVLLPGDLIGSGTVGTGCILEIHDEAHPWLEPGDEVRLEIDRLGALASRITEYSQWEASRGWIDTP